VVTLVLSEAVLVSILVMLVAHTVSKPDRSGLIGVIAAFTITSLWFASFAQRSLTQGRDDRQKDVIRRARILAALRQHPHDEIADGQ